MLLSFGAFIFPFVLLLLSLSYCCLVVLFFCYLVAFFFAVLLSCRPITLSSAILSESVSDFESESESESESRLGLGLSLSRCLIPSPSLVLFALNKNFTT